MVGEMTVKEKGGRGDDSQGVRDNAGRGDDSQGDSWSVR